MKIRVNFLLQRAGEVSSLSLSLSGTKINLDIWMWFAPRTEEILRGDLRLDSNFLKIDWSKRIIWSAPK